MFWPGATSRWSGFTRWFSWTHAGEDLRVKTCHEGVVRNKAVYVALALTLSDEKEVLGLWIEQTEGAKFRLGVLNELKTRGVGDILIAVVDGLKGFPRQSRLCSCK